MKQTYEIPVLEIVSVTSNDVIATSGNIFVGEDDPFEFPV